MKKIFLLVIMSLFLLSVGCQNSSSDAKDVSLSHDKSEMVVSIGGEPNGKHGGPNSGFDPSFDWPGLGEALFQSKLIVFNEDMNLINDLAKERYFTEDGKKLVIKIHEDILCSDGQLLTANDVVFTMKKVAETTSYIDLSNIEKTVATDDNTVEFHFKKPDSTFEYTLARIAIIPEHAYGENYGQNPIGSGPYKLVEWQKGQKLVIEENPLYYGKKPNIKKVTFLYLNKDATFAGLKRGEIDFGIVSFNYIGQQIEGYRERQLETMDCVSLSLPVVKSGAYEIDGISVGNDVTSDTAIRRALSYGVDRSNICQNALRGGAKPVFSHNPGMPWDNPQNPIQDNNIEQAKQILKEGGWEDSDGDGIVDKDGVKAEFTILYTAGKIERQAVALGVQESGKKIGIKINLDAKSWDEIRDKKLIYKEGYIFGKGADSPFEIYTNFSSTRVGTGTTNSPSYASKLTDSYLEKALNSTNYDESLEYWKKAQWDGKHGVNSLGDCPFVPLVSFDQILFIRDGVRLGDFRPAPHRGGYWITVENIKEWNKKHD